jgi:hypothetical protein
MFENHQDGYAFINLKSLPAYNFYPVRSVHHPRCTQFLLPASLQHKVYKYENVFYLLFKCHFILLNLVVVEDGVNPPSAYTA